ncbi:DUF3613 domain-containing protein [Fontimonas sp. SYSU GA230001]|uniref:DUF3613 domain-containing protein n=1 Tax=Fontimonas sp. SYSU GA230001 TaxID=3142450 RepID=UPI0032B4E4CE
MNHRRGMLTALMMLGLPLAALAAEPREPAVGDDTRTWLEYQESGRAAPPDVRPMPGEVADKVYQRYLQSFEHKIPERYERERFVSSGSGGS